MSFYLVSAKPIESHAAVLLGQLRDGSFAAGAVYQGEIQRALSKARLGADGRARWSETCHCASPLKAERTHLDQFFIDIRTEQVADEPDLAGEPLLDALERLAQAHRPSARLD